MPHLARRRMPFAGWLPFVLLLAACGDKRPMAAGPIVIAPAGYYELCRRQPQDLACLGARP